MKYQRNKGGAHLENYQKHKSIPGGGSQSRVLNKSKQQTGNALTLPPSMCPDSELPTLADLLTSPTLQELGSATAQGNCQGKNFLIPQGLGERVKKTNNNNPGGEWTGVTTTTTLQRLPNHPHNLQISPWA